MLKGDGGNPVEEHSFPSPVSPQPSLSPWWQVPTAVDYVLFDIPTDAFHGATKILIVKGYGQSIGLLKPDYKTLKPGCYVEASASRRGPCTVTFSVTVPSAMLTTIETAMTAATAATVTAGMLAAKAADETLSSVVMPTPIVGPPPPPNTNGTNQTMNQTMRRLGPGQEILGAKDSSGQEYSRRAPKSAKRPSQSRTRRFAAVERFAVQDGNKPAVDPDSQTMSIPGTGSHFESSYAYVIQVMLLGICFCVTYCFNLTSQSDTPRPPSLFGVQLGLPMVDYQVAVKKNRLLDILKGKMRNGEEPMFWLLLCPDVDHRCMLHEGVKWDVSQKVTPVSGEGRDMRGGPTGLQMVWIQYILLNQGAIKCTPITVEEEVAEREEEHQQRLKEKELKKQEKELKKQNKASSGNTADTPVSSSPGVGRGTGNGSNQAKEDKKDKKKDKKDKKKKKKKKDEKEIHIFPSELYAPAAESEAEISPWQKGDATSEKSKHRSINAEAYRHGQKATRDKKGDVEVKFHNYFREGGDDVEYDVAVECYNSLETGYLAKAALRTTTTKNSTGVFDMFGGGAVDIESAPPPPIDTARAIHIYHTLAMVCNPIP
jgi:hypothetical protein